MLVEKKRRIEFSQFLTTKFDNICLSENTNSVQMKNLNSVIEKKIDKELDFLFGDISSPYYALFNKKMETVETFSKNSERKIDQLKKDKEKVSKLLAKRKEHYDMYKGILNPLYKKYLNLNIEITKDFNRLNDLKKSAIDFELETNLKEEKEKLEKINNFLKNELEELSLFDQNHLATLDKEIKEEGVKFCKIYYCSLSHPALSYYMRGYCRKSRRRDPLCEGEFTTSTQKEAASIGGLCHSIAPELKKYWSIGKSDFKLLKECDLSF